MIEVVYETSKLIVVNKPAGMPCHPLHPGEGGTALDAVIEHYPEVAFASDSAREGGLCHRLDNNTSGLLLFARDPITHQKMREAFTKGQLKREYLAIVSGELKETLILTKPIAHHQKNQRKMVACSDKIRYRGNPQPAKTTAKPIPPFSHTATLLLVHLEGGRRHQIRVHLADAGCPLIGDILYGGAPAKALPGQALHAYKMRLLDQTEITVDPPANFWSELSSENISHEIR